MNSSYLAEAFKSLDILEEEQFNLENGNSMNEIKKFIEDNDELDVVDIIDMDFDDVEDVDDVEVEDKFATHVGDVICDCPVCHSKIYKSKDDIVLDDDEEFANVGEECPYCYSADGFKIVGQVAPFNAESEESEDEGEDVKVTVDDKEFEDKDPEEEDKDFEESLNRKSRKIKNRKNMNENFIEYEKIEKFIPDEINCSRDDFGYVCDKVEDAKKLVSIVKNKINGYDASRFNKEVHIFKESLKESKDVDLTEYQKWVDYDMRKYHKISDITMNKIKKAGLSVVKDQYGEYEVIADRADSDAKNESLKKFKTENCDRDKKCNDKKCEKEKKLTEARWNYTLECGNALRDAIDSGDVLEVQTALHDAYSELMDSGLIDEDDYASWTEDLMMVDTDDEDEMDYQLSEFYDLCDNLGVWIPLSESFNKKKVSEGFEKVEIETDTDRIKIETEPKSETIIPVESEVKTEIETEQEVEPEESEDEVEFDVNEFDETKFDELGESYLRKVYENVDSYKTVNVGLNSQQTKLVVEGVIKFKSGNQKKTKFIFESKDATKSGKVRFLGENCQISRGKKSFTLRGQLNNGKFISESLNYNYRAKDSAGQSIRLYGTIKAKN